MFLPYNVDVPMERLPIANWLLIGATVIHSMALLIDPTVDQAFGNRPQFPMQFDETRLPSFVDLGIHRGEGLALGQLITYTFVHGGFMHLAGNMIFLFCFGNAVNAKIGQLPYLLLYFAMGIAAGLVWLLLGRGRVAIGASGAIMGITGVYVVLYPRNYVTVFWGMGGLGWWGGVTEIAGGWVVFCEILFNLWGWLLPVGNVAHEAHLGGLLIGLATGLFLVKTRLIKSSPYEENLLQWLRKQSHAKRRSRRRRRPRRPPESLEE